MDEPTLVLINKNDMVDMLLHTIILPHRGAFNALLDSTRKNIKY